jgi:flagellar biosynthesis protein FlhF
MDVRTYRAATMQAALEQIRKELGPEAAVLHSRQKPAGWMPWQRAEIEVTASNEVAVRRHFAEDQKVPGSADVDRQFADRQIESPYTSPESRLKQDGDLAADRAAEVAEQIRQAIRPTDSDLAERVSPAPITLPFPGSEKLDSKDADQRQLLDDLESAGVHPKIAEQWIQALSSLDGVIPSNPTESRQRLAQIVAADIRTSGPIQTTPSRCTRVALVGPTGVGKTTTIAKLAAEYHLRKQVKVGLITADTFRISAIEQLKTYAEIMDLPMEVASTAREMSAALAAFDSLDLVFIDTAGHSPKDDVQFGRLRSLLSVAKCDEIHLVLSATSHTRSLQQSLRQFAQIQFNRLILSKQDEVASLGHLADVLTDDLCPWSYVTSGQCVPDDIESADTNRLARKMIAAS